MDRAATIYRYLLGGILIFAFQNCQQESRQVLTSDFNLETAVKVETAAWAIQPEAIINRVDAPVFPEKTYLLSDFGHPEKLAEDCKQTLQMIIDSCHTAGGGKVVVPKGLWTSKGPIHLKSNVHLYLEEGANLRFSDDAVHYLPLVKVRWEGTVCWNYSPLIYAYQQENIALTGKGTIDGNGKQWSIDWRKVQNDDKKTLRQMGNDKVPENQRVFGNGFLDLNQDGQDDGFGDGKPHWLRPALIEFYECKAIKIDSLIIKNSPFWTVHPVFSKNITISNLKIFGGYLNDDGIDPDSCEDVLIEGCYIETEDDAIAIKAGRDQDAWDRPPCKNILIRNCELNSGVNSFCIGSEMSGGVENIFVEDCHILSGKHGLNFKCNLDRGGQVQHIFMRNIEIDYIEEAMFIFRMDYHGYRGNNFPTKFNDFYAQNIKCKKVDGLPFKIVGVEAQPISEVLLHNIDIKEAKDKSKLSFAQEVVVKDVNVNGKPWIP